MRMLMVGAMVLGIGGCTAANWTAEMVRSPGQQSAYGPEDELATGEVRYFSPASGGLAYTKDREEDARRKMFEACDGHYRIEAESDDDETKPADLLFRGRTVYHHIRFSCVVRKVAPLDGGSP